MLVFITMIIQFFIQKCKIYNLGVMENQDHAPITWLSYFLVAKKASLSKIKR